MLAHSKTRKKSIVDDLADEGLGIGYKRVLEIEETITQQLCEKYEKEGIVCPPSLIKNVFTFAAIDNIDNNPTSSTATSSFHGTCISIFQQHASDRVKEPFIIEKCNKSKKSHIKLPDYYTDIKPTVAIKPESTKGTFF